MKPQYQGSLGAPPAGVSAVILERYLYLTEHNAADDVCTLHRHAGLRNTSKTVLLLECGLSQGKGPNKFHCAEVLEMQLQEDPVARSTC